MSRLKIWTDYRPLRGNIFLLQRQIGEEYVITQSDLTTAQIAFGQPEADQVIRLPTLRWIHVNTAGYTRFDRDDVRAALRARGAMLTNSSSVYSEPCAQQVLAMMLAMARQFPQSLANHAGPRAWPMDERRNHCVLLNGQNVLLIGYGAIGRRLAELLAPFHVNVTAIRRNPKDDDSVNVVGTEKLPELLGWADHVIDLLPASESTRNTFTADRFAQMKPSAIFYNIGRGDTVDQLALQHTLESGRIAAAFIDVTTPEPLPPDDPLWRTPNCYITPHTAGGHANEVERVIGHFVENLRRFQGGEELNDRII